MDPGEALRSDQQVFEQELESMITDVISGSSSAASTLISPLSPPPEHDELRETPRKRTYPSHTPPTEYSPASPPTKRAKTDNTMPSSALTSEFMHPSRIAMLHEQHADLQKPPGPRRSSGFSAGLPSGSISPAPTQGVTAANANLLGPCTGTASSTWSTLANTVQRQWDPRKSDLEYEELLRHRRNERVSQIDRYIPVWAPTSKQQKTKKQPFRFETLPENVRDKILVLLLVGDEPITIDFSWLRPFVKGHARVPAVTQKLQGDDGAGYLCPVSWPKLLADVDQLNGDMAKFKGALEARGTKTKGRRSPARFLTTSLLRVSRTTHKAAARVFYSHNTFHFSYAPAAWMQLESFLDTIGSNNVAEIKHLRIAAPMFHRGMQEDYVEGAILDLMSPATRMAIVKPPPRDRLLSAITHSTTKLMTAASLENLALDLQHPMASDLWSGRYVNDKRLISVADAERSVLRKAAGTAILKQASEALAATGSKPTLTLYHFSKASRTDVNQFRGAMSALVTEADKYGWRVCPRLEDGK